MIEAEEKRCGRDGIILPDPNGGLVLSNDSITILPPEVRAEPTLESTLAQIACGDVDGITPPEGCEALAKMFDLPFALVPSAGHASYIDAPDAVAGWIEHAVLSQSQNA